MGCEGQMACDFGGGFLASYLFADMKQSAEEDENWIDTVGLQRRIILSTLMLSFSVKHHNKYKLMLYL